MHSHLFFIQRACNPVSLAHQSYMQSWIKTSQWWVRLQGVYNKFRNSIVMFCCALNEMTSTLHAACIWHLVAEVSILQFNYSLLLFRTGRHTAGQGSAHRISHGSSSSHFRKPSVVCRDQGEFRAGLLERFAYFVGWHNFIQQSSLKVYFICTPTRNYRGLWVWVSTLYIKYLQHICNR